MAQRCHYCGRTEKEHHGIACFGAMGGWVGQNMKGGEKPPLPPPKKIIVKPRAK